MGRDTKRTLTLRKRHFFAIEKSVEDVKQDEKHVPDLLESIIQPPDPVKDELWPKLFKITQIMSKITKIRVCTFQMSGKIRDSTNVAFEEPLFAIFGPGSAADDGARGLPWILVPDFWSPWRLR